MTMINRLRIGFAAGTLLFLAMGSSDRLLLPIPYDLISTAEARVGRPLTPVSVAGVARRTVRRCAVGVYNC
jgi:hypothetical protein